ncbi:MAG: P-loop NTPase fold protein [Spirochaetia bacterium]
MAHSNFNSLLEIREVFRLVRLVADFPNVLYILAFDREQVEAALAPSGRQYQEKILQLSYDLPRIPEHVLRKQLLSAIEDAFEGRNGPFDHSRWVDVFFEVVLPFFRNMRDVRRYAIAVRVAVDSLKAQVEMTDILALESVRMFLPQVFGKLHSMIPALTESFAQADKSAKASLQDLIALGDPQQRLVSSFLMRIFPVTQRHLANIVHRSDEDWLRARRVAHRDVLLYYLERTGLTVFNQAETAFALMGDRQSFDKYMRSIEPSELEDVISYLESFQSDFRPAHVVSGVIVLENLRSVIPERARKGMFDFGTDLVVGRVVLRLFWALKDKGKLEEAVRSILPQIESLSGRYDVIRTVGYKDEQEELLPEPVVMDLERNWRSQVRACSSQTLQNERHLLEMLLAVMNGSQTDEPAFTISEEPSLMLAILKSARSESLSQGGSSRAVIRTPVMQWKALVKLFGSEAELKRRIEVLADEKAREPQLMALVDDYISGRAQDPLP